MNEIKQILLTALREDLSSFVRKSFEIIDPATTYLHNWHIDLISEYLTACRSREIKRLIINIPPRFMKSICVSSAFPAWLLGNNPSEQIVVSSYSQSLSRKHSEDCRLVMKNGIYREAFPNTRISQTQDTKDYFKTTKQGQRFATSVGGSSTGFGGNFLIVDDPHNPAQAVSDVQRLTALNWFDQTFSSRLNDKKNGVVIVIMQRLHEQDLSGHLLEKGGWEHLKIQNETERQKTYSFPVSKKEKTVFKGELLHPDRMDIEETKQTKIDLGSYAYSGQYQQRPTPLGSGEFKSIWYKYYDEIKTGQGMNIFIIVDPANEKKKTSDYTAMLVIGLAPDRNYYLLDIVRDRLNPTERVEALFNLHRKWNEKSGKPPKVGYEKYGIQSDIHYIEEKQKELGYRFNIVEIGGRQAKEDRIRRLIPIIEAGRFYFPKSLIYIDLDNSHKELIKELINEFSFFPVGTHDDMIDGMARIVETDLNATFPTVILKNNSYNNYEKKGWF